MGVNQGTMLTKRVALLSLFLAGTVLGQPDLAPRWRTYTTADGLSQPALRFVTIAEDGSILAVADGPEFCRMDGYEVKSWPVPPETGRVYQSPAGQLWTISPQGLWAMSGSNTWALYSVPDIAGAVALCPVRQNAVLCLLPDRLIVFSSDPPGARTGSLHNVRQTKLNRFLGMTLGAEDELWITGENGVARVSGPTSRDHCRERMAGVYPARGLRLEHFEKPEPDAHGVTMVAISSANGERIAAHFDGEQWETLAAEEDKFSSRGAGGTIIGLRPPIIDSISRQRYQRQSELAFTRISRRGGGLAGDILAGHFGRIDPLYSVTVGNHSAPAANSRAATCSRPRKYLPAARFGCQRASGLFIDDPYGGHLAGGWLWGRLAA